MKRKYSVFLGNVGSCSDRYCAAYGRTYSLPELFERAASIELLSGVDIVLSPAILEDIPALEKLIKSTGLKPVSFAVDHFAQAKWRQGTFSSLDKQTRQEAVAATKEAMDIASGLGCDLVTIWPGQDGYDYIFQAD
ncbi:MAG: TIM barrel protein, partial [Terrimicrobiaceae bacterium]